MSLDLKASREPDYLLSDPVLHGKPILEWYRGTQLLRTILFHVLYELCATAGQCVCVQLLSGAERDRSVGSLGHYVFKASFTDGLCGVRGLALTVGNVSTIFPCVCFFNKPRTVGRSTHATFS